ncbi:hypothetical protein [Acinetobacter radioresistens]|uniref:hypothetical protein n=1 Tax=Acinetobacter radioresistens TaxID=40216 RepID=UPI003215725C
MNSVINNADYRHMQQVQSFYDTALRILDELFKHNQNNLRLRNQDVNNAAVRKTDLTEQLARRCRLNNWFANEVVASLVKSGTVEAFGGYMKPKAGEV